MAGTVKGRKAARHATSDWMRLEQQRGISVTSSVMQFPYDDHIVNLLDTPGHEDFSEDTYRTLTAVDSALMVIDCAKGVEERTIKLMEVCRLRDTPIMTFINKLDRDGRPPIELLDEIERVLGIRRAPVTWPVGMGRELKGSTICSRTGSTSMRRRTRPGRRQSCGSKASDRPRRSNCSATGSGRCRGARAGARRDRAFDLEAYRAGRQTPVFFGSAISNFGVRGVAASFVRHAPAPLPRLCRERKVQAERAEIHAVSFSRSRRTWTPGIATASPSCASAPGATSAACACDTCAWTRTCASPMRSLSWRADRTQAEEAFAGDIVGLHNHGTINIGDSFSEGESCISPGFRISRRRYSVARC